MKRLAFKIICLQSLCLGVIAAWFNFPVDGAVTSVNLKESNATKEQKSSSIGELAANKAASKESESRSNLSAKLMQIKGENIPVLQQPRLPPSQVWVIDGEKQYKDSRLCGL